MWSIIVALLAHMMALLPVSILSSVISSVTHDCLRRCELNHLHSTVTKTMELVGDLKRTKTHCFQLVSLSGHSGQKTRSGSKGPHLCLTYRGYDIPWPTLMNKPPATYATAATMLSFWLADWTPQKWHQY